METAIDFSAESMADDSMFQSQSSDFYGQTTVNSASGGDDEDDDSSDDSSDSDPELDPDVNTAPVVVKPSPNPVVK